MASALAKKGIAVFAYDRCGWGKSTGARGKLPTPGAAYRELDRVTEHLKASGYDVHLLGLSFGGLLALLAAWRNPSSFASLTLIAPGIIASQNPTFAQRLKLAFGFFLWRRLRYPLPFLPEDFAEHPESVRFVAHDPLRVTSITADTAVSVFRMRLEARRLLKGRLPLPSLVFLAGKDRIIDTPRTQKLLVQAGARITLYEDASHSLVLDHPERLAHALEDWLDEPTP